MSRARQLAAFLCAWLALPIIAQHAPPASAPTVADRVRSPRVDAAETDSPRLRILSGAPNVTEICCALGLADQLVGRTRYCAYPPEVQALPSIGALFDANTEFVLSLKPDLIVLSGGSRAMRERLEPLGLRLESVPDARLEDLFVAIERIGDWTGRPRTAAALCAELRAELAPQSVRARARVLLLTGTMPTPPGPIGVAGPGSFYHELLERAGFAAALGPDAPPFGVLSLEGLLRAQPEVVIELDATGTRARAPADEAWRSFAALPAVQRGRVHTLSGEAHFLLGPRIGATYRELCALARQRQP